MTSNNQTNKTKHREFSLTTFAVDNATSIFILTLMIFLFGLRAYRSMPKEQFPEVSFPTIYVNTPYFGNSATEIENLVTRPIERELMGLNGLKDVRSTSLQDYSVIIAEFQANVKMEDALQKVKDGVDIAKGELPDDISADPTVLEINLANLPIVSINISGDFTTDELRDYAEFIEEELDGVDEISKIDIKGSRDREVKINVDLPQMQSRKISFQDIENAIKSENLNMSAGEMVNNEFRRGLRVIGQFETIEQIRNMIIKSEYQKPIYLKEIANVQFAYADPTSIARSDGFPVVSLDIIKQRGKNLLDAADKISEVIEEVKPQLPADLKITTFNDQSINTRNEVQNLENSIISGVILVVLVLLFFLGLRNASFVGMAIPLSMLTGITILYLMGVTMNIVVLFSLILALGLLVDNGIVVVENIYRYYQEGYDLKTASKYGAGEVAVPIIASTATTLAAFVPLAFWPGLMGQFMKYLPITLIIVLVSSLFVALVINPVFTSRFMKIDEHHPNKALRDRKRRSILIGVAVEIIIAIGAHFAGIEWLRNIMGFAALLTLVNFFLLRPVSFWFQDKVLTWLERTYDRFIDFSLKGFKPTLIFISTILLLFGAIALLVVRSPKVINFPSAEPVYINAFVDLPIGSDIAATDKVVTEIERRIDQALEGKRHIVEAVLTQLGENTSDPNRPPEPGASPNRARITVSFVEAKKRGGISTSKIMSDIRTNLKDIAGAKVVVDKNADGPATGKPINIELLGDDIDQLAEVAENMRIYINNQNIPGIEELLKDINRSKPELLIHIDREAARRYELSTYNIAMAIRTSVFGKEISKYKTGEDEYPVMVRLDPKYRNDISELMNQKVTFRNPVNGQLVQIPISAVASIDYNSTYSSIKRKDMTRAITIFSNVLDGYNANEINRDIKSALADFDLPEGITYAFTGEQQQQAEDMAFLNGAFTLAVFLIFIILVAQFNSIVSPFIIILSIVFSTIGVFLGYAVGGRDISVIFTGVGIISLAGIVVNNAIVLVDYINLLVHKKQKALGLESEFDVPKEDVRQAIIQAGGTRLRPVLLTAITTVLGLYPLAVGLNINFFSLITELDPQIFIGGDSTQTWGPMAWTVIYGLVFSTFLTLVVVPTMYWLAYRLVRRWAHRRQRIKAKRAALV